MSGQNVPPEDLSATESFNGAQRNLLGPASWANYRAYLQGSPRVGSEEYGIYSDTHFTGQLLSGIGPYRFYNTMPPLDEFGGFAESVVLRVDRHLAPGKGPDLTKTQITHWHGGFIDDELAALLSLATGRRVRSGGLVRVFVEDADPRGHPVRWNHRAPNAPTYGRKQILVYSRIETSLADARALIAGLGNMPTDAATALIRAARSYADALWIADADPATSWLGFVSALETAADHWNKTPVDPVEALAAAKPKVYHLLGSERPEVLSRISAELQSITGATSKFLKFTVAHFPASPPKRPPEAYQVTWSKTQLKKRISLIYAFRSAALHAGVPLPGPMCLPPDELEADQYAERPQGPIAIGDAVWTDEDLPMFLHTFEYIARGALQKWWLELSGDHLSDNST